MISKFLLATMAATALVRQLVPANGDAQIVEPDGGYGPTNRLAVDDNCDAVAVTVRRSGAAVPIGRITAESTHSTGASPGLSAMSDECATRYGRGWRTTAYAPAPAPASAMNDDPAQHIRAA